VKDLGQRGEWPISLYSIIERPLRKSWKGPSYSTAVVRNLGVELGQKYFHENLHKNFEKIQFCIFVKIANEYSNLGFCEN